MAQFFAVIKGPHGGEVSRTGNKKNGLHTMAKSWNVQITTDFWFDHDAGVNHVRIAARNVRTGNVKVLFEGPEGTLDV